MPSQALPSAADGYAVTPDMRLSAALWNAVIGELAARLGACEAVRADLQALIDAGTGQALAVIQANVGPQLAALNAQIADAQAALITAQGHIANLMNSQLPASNITFAPGDGITATSVQAAIAAVMAKALAVEEAAEVAGNALVSALALKADASAVYTRAQVDALIAAKATSYATVLKYR